MRGFVSIEEFGKAFIPKHIRPKLRSHLLKAGIQDIPYHQYGWIFITSIILTGLIYIGLFYQFLKDQNPVVFMILTMMFWFLIQLGTLIVAMTVLYMYYDIKIFDRTLKMEDVIEEFLRYVSENLKAGMPFEKALWAGIRPQFGVLSDEIKLVAKKVMTGQDTAEALTEFTEKYESPTLKRAFQLVIEGLQGGGEIAYLIDKIETDIRSSKDLKGEINATNTNFVIFIAAVVLVITPLLFGISYNLLLVIKGLTSKITATNSNFVSLTLDPSRIHVNEAVFERFSSFALIIIATASSLILSIIRKGNIKEGLKYIPVFVITSLVMLMLFKAVLTSFFKGFMSL
jgi:hypothetical protein